MYIVTFHLKKNLSSKSLFTTQKLIGVFIKLGHLLFSYLLSLSLDHRETVFCAVLILVGNAKWEIEWLFFSVIVITKLFIEKMEGI